MASKPRKISENILEIKKEGKMNVPGIVFASDILMDNIIKDNKTIDQVKNVAQLPGIVEKSLAMPDAHCGYGFPIGGVAAFDIEKGVISPGGVGYDINCGVRLLVTDIKKSDFMKKRKEILDEIYKNVPSGVGKESEFKLSDAELSEVLNTGINWAVKKGYATQQDQDRMEDNGCIEGADAKAVSQKAKARGRSQLGSLGSGNHFLEIQQVQDIYDEKTAKSFGIKNKDQITIMIHCGSRGLGHQTASDYIQKMEKEYGFAHLPDRELACAPINSPLGQDYKKAMNAAANFAFTNRQLITHQIRKSFHKFFPKAKIDLVYDICHNIAKMEEHNVNGKNQMLCVHRKGATRSFGPGRKEIPSIYRKIGQPIFIPGSMGTFSYVLVGTKKAEEISFGSTCFTGDTKIITNKGVFKLEEINNKFMNGEGLSVPSINENTMQIEWKPIVNTFKREAEVIEIVISQTNRSNLSKLRTTKDHNFITLKNFNLTNEKIEDIISSEKMLISLDNLKTPSESKTNIKLAYLIGALMTDGHFYLNKRHGKVTFTQKKTQKKLNFISYVQDCFRECFNTELKEYKTKFGGGIIRGRRIYGEGTDFVCSQKAPAAQIINIASNLPLWVMNLDEEATLNFLAGVVDGDGTYEYNRGVLSIYNGDEDLTAAILLACLKIGILPYISKQRGSCFIIQISEKEELIFNYTKRIKADSRKRKYGQKLFSAKQMFDGLSVKWPYYHKSRRNNLISHEQILKHIHKYPGFKNLAKILVNSPIRMQRVKKLKDIGMQGVYNIEVADNHNYVVLTDMFMPIFVKNCHGAGRLLSRSFAIKNLKESDLKKNMEKQDILLKTGSMKGALEEAPEAYKDVNEVARVSDELGIGQLVARLKPLAVVKG